MDDRRLELRVALLALAALVSGAGLLWLIGAFKDTGEARLKIDFAHSGGVPVGAPVRVAGVQVGRVRDITLAPERLDSRGQPMAVTMDLTLQGRVLEKLHHDARVGVAMQGALGEPFVEIDPGVGAGAALKSGDELRGEDPPRLDLLLARMDKLTETAADLLASGVTDGGAMGLLADASHLTRGVDSLLGESHDSIVGTLKDVRDAASDLREVAAQSKQLLASGKVRGLVDDASTVASNLKENVPPLMTDARQLAHSANNMAGDFTPEDGAQLKAAIARYEKASESMEDIATRANKLLKEIDEGKGSVGGLVKDDQVYKDLKALVADLKAHPWKVLWK